MTSTTSTRDGIRKSRTAPTAPGTHSRRTGHNPKYVPDDGFHPALPQPSAGGTEHAPDTDFFPTLLTAFKKKAPGVWAHQER